MTGDPHREGRRSTGSHPEIDRRPALVRQPRHRRRRRIHCVSAIPYVCARRARASRPTSTCRSSRARGRSSRGPRRVILDRFKLTGPRRDRDRRGQGHRRAASRSRSPRRAPTSCAPRARAQTSRPPRRAVRARGRRALAVPCDVHADAERSSGSSRAALAEFGRHRRAREQRGRHRRRAPALADERALLRERAALQRDAAPSCSRSSCVPKHGRDRRRRRGREHLVALERHGADGFVAYGGGQGRAQHDDAQSSPPSSRRRCASTRSRWAASTTEALEVVLTNDALRAPVRAQHADGAARHGRGHRRLRALPRLARGELGDRQGLPGRRRRRSRPRSGSRPRRSRSRRTLRRLHVRDPHRSAAAVRRCTMLALGAAPVLAQGDAPAPAPGHPRRPPPPPRPRRASARRGSAASSSTRAARR